MLKNFKNSILVIFFLSLGVVLSGCTSQKEAEVAPEPVVETQEAPVLSESENSEDMNSLRTITLEEVAEHNTPEDCWLAISGRVYDVTGFIASGNHDPMIAKGCGLDATKFFEGQAKHDKDSVRDLRATFEIGMIKE